MQRNEINITKSPYILSLMTHHTSEANVNAVSERLDEYCTKAGYCCEKKGTFWEALRPKVEPFMSYSWW